MISKNKFLIVIWVVALMIASCGAPPTSQATPTPELFEGHIEFLYEYDPTEFPTEWLGNVGYHDIVLVTYDPVEGWSSVAAPKGIEWEGVTLFAYDFDLPEVGMDKPTTFGGCTWTYDYSTSYTFTDCTSIEPVVIPVKVGLRYCSLNDNGNLSCTYDGRLNVVIADDYIRFQSFDYFEIEYAEILDELLEAYGITTRPRELRPDTVYTLEIPN